MGFYRLLCNSTIAFLLYFCIFSSKLFVYQCFAKITDVLIVGAYYNIVNFGPTVSAVLLGKVHGVVVQWKEKYLQKSLSKWYRISIFRLFFKNFKLCQQSYPLHHGNFQADLLHATTILFLLWRIRLNGVAFVHQILVVDLFQNPNGFHVFDL
jgi:hypothetical protein